MKGLRNRKGNYFGEFYDPEKNPLRTRDKRQAEQLYLQLQRAIVRFDFGGSALLDVLFGASLYRIETEGREIMSENI